MFVPPPLKCRNQGDDHEGQNGKGEQNMRNKQREINPRDQATVAGRLFADVHMINDVTDQKRG